MTKVLHPSTGYRSRHWICAIATTLLGFCASAGTPLLAAEPTLAQAIEAYDRAMSSNSRSIRLQRFATAEQLFRQAVEQLQQEGTEPDPRLLVALGNAALQAEHIGASIVAFRHAIAIQPGNQQARQNLDFSRSLVPDWVRLGETANLGDTLFFWRSMLSTSQQLLLSSIAFAIAMLLLAAGIYTGIGILRWSAFLPLVIWLVILAGLFVVGGMSSLPNAVVVAEECWLHSADSDSSPLKLSQPIPDGAELRTLRQRDRWVEVEVSGRTGWILASSIEILPHR